MTTSTVNKAVASALAAVMLVIGAGCGVQQQSAPAAVNWEERYPGYKTDFYEAVNKAQFDEWEIPDSDPSIGHFIALDRENNQRLLKLMEDAAQSAGTTDDSDTAVVGALWATGNDIEARNAGGFGNAQRFIDAVDEPGRLFCLQLHRFGQPGQLQRLPGGKEDGLHLILLLSALHPVPPT